MLEKIAKFFKDTKYKMSQWRKFKRNYIFYKELHEKIHQKDCASLYNLKYEIMDEIKKGISYPMPKVKTIDESIDDILKNKKSVCRYGDGEFYTLFDKYDDKSFMLAGDQLHMLTDRFYLENWSKRYYKQKRNPELVEKLRFILKSNNDNVLVCIPDWFGSLKDYREGGVSVMRAFMAQAREELLKYIDLDKTYGNSFISRFYTPYIDETHIEGYLENIKRLWLDRDIVIVEGDGSRLGLGNDLFDGAKSIERVLCPAEGAFDKYSEIFDYTKTLPKDKLILIALGMTATVLAYDLAQEGFQAIDIGHIDIEYEVYTRGEKWGTELPNKYINEIGRYDYSEVKDEKYHSQIIKKFV